MEYVDYLGNVTRFAVELVNSPASASDGHQMFTEHEVTPPGPAELAPLLKVIRAALGQIVDGVPVDAVDTLLRRYPPRMHLSDHDGEDHPHIHFARNGEEPVRWIGQTVGAALAHVATGDPGLTLGRCAADGCEDFFVDQSKNRTRRFCSNTCASRTTVAAYRARNRV
ncbi:putative RNA-binding Zn ribbon-like protein [Hamadaea flava]|uniref:CGNR zinc finger domain-containing protein n=1 Tax=Hamadaea flava TaxID=1742688 RepID=A0ABV8LKG1_9ACTN|nr:CGNR zinc finger domain-containing protein [Hamadaea flava]MCP2323753.1 putative RNA-binding Zn ribbon-like protein [Hamadaea flava]